MFSVDKGRLYELYIIQKMPMHAIAKEMGISVGSVFNYIKKYYIPTRAIGDANIGRKLSPEHCKIISKTHKGKIVSPETRKKMSEADKRGGVGHKKKRPDGYVKIYFPDHPSCSKDGYIMEHILVMEALIGRHLKDNECVHHVNEIKDDNRKENLKLMTKSEHMSYHSAKRHEKRRSDLSIK